VLEVELVLTISGQAPASQSPLLESEISERAFEGRPVLRSTVPDNGLEKIVGRVLIE
jgi:hypothetical protein